MEIIPLPKRIYDKAKEIGTTSIELQFQGGSDEGFLNVYISCDQEGGKYFDLYDEIEEWAQDAYQYNGAGDGSDYGDNIEYNLYSMTASHSEWHTERVDGSSCEIKLEVDDQEPVKD
jgi:hypothetical protein